MRFFLRSHTQAMFVLPVLAACTESGDAPDVVSNAGAHGGDSSDDTPGDCKEGSRRDCRCDSSSGQATCAGGSYGACECTADHETMQDAGAGAPRKPQPYAPMCKPGYYTGGFTGMYSPGLVGLGILNAGIDVDVMGADDAGVPSLALTLEESSSGAGEFVTYSVEGGCMSGLAEAGGTQTPFVARLTGDLDCSTGKFNGQLNGYYTFVGVPGFDFQFTGPFIGQFSPATTALDGTWMIMEPPALDGEPAGGGQGTWHATLQSASAPDGGEDPCKDIPAADAADAGAESAAQP